MKNCPCGSNKAFEECCQPIIENKREADTAEILMRSRYTAFTITDVDYLMRSHHSKTRPIKDKRNIKKWAQSVKWIKLSIMDSKAGGIDDIIGEVQFKAMFIENGQLDQIHERSVFEKENNKWVYVKGTHIPS